MSHTEEDVQPPAGLPAGLVRLKRGTAGISALAHDGRLMAVAQTDNKIALMAPKKEDAVLKLPPHSSVISAMAFAPDGQALASAAGSDVFLWKVVTGEKLQALRGHRAAVKAIAFAPNSRRLVTAAMDGTLRVWEAATGAMLAKAEWNTPHAADANEPVRVTSTLFTDLHAVWLDKGGGCGVLCTLMFGNSRVCEEAVVRFDSCSGKILSRDSVPGLVSTAVSVARSGLALNLGQASNPVAAVAPGRGLLARPTASGHVALLDLRSRAATNDLHAACLDVEMSANRVALVKEGGTAVYLWDWKKTEPPRPLLGHTGRPFLVGFTPRGDKLVSASRESSDQALSVWDCAKETQLRQVEWNPGATGGTMDAILRNAPIPFVAAPRLAPDGQHLALRGLDGKLSIVEVGTEKRVGSAFEWRGDGCMAFMADGKQLLVSDHAEWRNAVVAVGGARNTESASHLHLIDAASGKIIRQLTKTSMDFAIGRLRVARERIIAGCRDGTVRALDMNTGKVVSTLWQPKQALPAVLLSTINHTPFFVVSADERMFAIRAQDGHKIHLFETATGKERLNAPLAGYLVTSMGFDAEGRHLVTGSQDGTVLVWTLDAMDAEKSLPDADKLWQELGDSPAPAFRALRNLLGHPAEALALANKHMKPTRPIDKEAALARIRELDSEVFAVRQKAQDELIAMGDPILELIDKAVSGPETSNEAKQRLTQIRTRLDTSSPAGEHMRSVRAIELLERIGSGEALAIVRRLAEGAPAAAVTREARAALARTEMFRNKSSEHSDQAR